MFESYIPQSYDEWYRNDDEFLWYVNSELAKEQNSESIFNWIDEQILSPSKCKFCNQQLALSNFYSYLENQEIPLTGSFMDLVFSGYNEENIVTVDREPDVMDYEITQLAVCLNCWYWHWFYGGTLTGSLAQWNVSTSKLRDFDPNLPEGFDSEIAQHLRRNPKLWNRLNPTALEKLVSDIWRFNYSNADVMHVGRPYDGGVDVLYVDTEKNQHLIQVKRRSNFNKGEGASGLANLVGVMVQNKTTYGAYVTTAGHFTPTALNYVKEVTDIGYTINLVDRAKLDRMLKPFRPHNPWMDYINNNYRGCKPKPQKIPSA